MPAETPSPWRRTSCRASVIAPPLLALAELVIDQGDDRGHRLGGALALGLDRDRRALGRHQGQQAQDALAVDLVRALDHGDLARELRPGLNELGARARVQAYVVL